MWHQADSSAWRNLLSVFLLRFVLLNIRNKDKKFKSWKKNNVFGQNNRDIAIVVQVEFKDTITDRHKVNTGREMHLPSSAEGETGLCETSCAHEKTMNTWRRTVWFAVWEAPRGDGRLRSEDTQTPRGSWCRGAPGGSRMQTFRGPQTWDFPPVCLRRVTFLSGTMEMDPREFLPAPISLEVINTASAKS